MTDHDDPARGSDDDLAKLHGSDALYWLDKALSLKTKLDQCQTRTDELFAENARLLTTLESSAARIAELRAENERLQIALAHLTRIREEKSQ